MDALHRRSCVPLAWILAVSLGACVAAGPGADLTASDASFDGLPPSMEPSIASMPPSMEPSFASLPPSMEPSFASLPPSMEPSAGACPAILLADAPIADQLVGVEVIRGEAVDRVRFTFALSSSPPPGAPATADVMTTLGPFVADPSGLPLPVAGVRFVVASFHGMTLSDTTPASAGSSPSVKLPGVRAVVRQSAYEGVTNWIVGYDVTGCLTAEVSAAAITIVVPHA